MRTKMKQVLATLLVLAICVSAINMNAFAEENDALSKGQTIGNEKYPYMMFAASKEDGAITINANNFSANGTIATNGMISSRGVMNVNGEQKENVNENMIYILKKIKNTYFSAENVDYHKNNYICNIANANINNPVETEGTIQISNNVNINNAIKAMGDINIKGNMIKANNSVICSEVGSITINAMNATLSGLIYAPNGDVVITSNQTIMNNIIIIANRIIINSNYIVASYNENFSEIIGTKSEDNENVGIWALGKHNAENNSIDIEWYTNCTDGSYGVWSSVDDQSYILEDTVEVQKNYQYLLNENFEQKYFKISLRTREGEVFISNTFLVVRDEEGYKLEFADKDGDNLPDVIEKELGTDDNNIDSDGDGLTDYQETYYLQTSPAKYDSITAGISDKEADFDTDGLSTGEEIEYGTSPRHRDTDEDGLSDGDEIKLYATNPLNGDSDEDGLDDGDEMLFELNPNEPDSDKDGILDGDEYFQQNVNIDKIDEILFEENDAILQELVVSAKGNVNDDIVISEYNGFLKGDDREYVGKAIEIDGTEIARGSISFQLSNTYSVKEYIIGENKTNGLIICYNDGENTIPLDTTYDEFSKTITADIFSEGIYFVLDVVEWVESLELQSPTENSEYIHVQSKARTMTLASEDETTIANVKVKGQVDIVFVIDTTGSMGTYISNVKNNITDFVNVLEEADIAASYALVEYRDITCDGIDSTKIRTNGDSNWFKDADEFKTELSSLTISGGGDTLETAIDGLEMARQLDLRKHSQKFFVLVTDAGFKIDNRYGIETLKEMTEYLTDDKINVSVVSGSSNELKYKSLYETTGGIFANVGGNFKNELLGIADLIEEETNNGYWIALDGLTPKIVKLDAQPMIGSRVDTDGDGLLDIEELKGILPQKIINVNNYLYSLGLPISYSYPTIGVYACYTSPILIDTDGDSVNDMKDLNPRVKARHSEKKYKQVSTFDYDFNTAFIDENLSGLRARTRELHGTANYDSYTLWYLKEKREYAYFIASAGIGLLGGINAGWALSWFLGNSGLDKELSLLGEASYVVTDYGSEAISRECRCICEFSEDVLKDGESIIIASKEPFISYDKDKALRISLLALNDMNWLATLGTSSGAMIARVMRTGDTYTMTYEYLVYDYYDWDLKDVDLELIPGLKNSELAQMNHAGIAKDYYHYGEIKNTYIWRK